MFSKLRNRLIIINVSLTSVILVVIFASVYILYTSSANRRPPMPFENNTGDHLEEVDDSVGIAIRNEKQTAARELLIMLVISGVAVEFAVALVSYFLAEEAIKPVREAYDAQKVFIANAAHEIKTPLAAISANLEAADIHNNHWISNVELEAEKLTALNKQLLSLARTDLVAEVKLEEVDLPKVVRGAIESFDSRMKKLDFEEKILVRQKIKINREDFLQIFSILMDNAVKYADKKIQLELNANELVIKNDGTTIPSDKLPHIFERFYQVDKTAEGVGLGLSIAKTVAERNHWSLKADSKNNETSFILKF